MAFTRMAFDPAGGLKDAGSYPTTPESETQARAQVQRVSDQLRDFINDMLISQLESTQQGQSGAGMIGSAPIDYVTGESVRAQIADIKRQIDDVSAGSVADGTITQGKLANGAVSADKLAAGAVTQSKLGEGAVTTDKLGDGAVSESKIGAGAVTASKIGVGAVSKAKLGADALAWTLVADSGSLLSSGSIPIASQAGKSEMMIQLRSQDGNMVYGTAIASLNTDGRTIPLMHNIISYDPSDFKCDYRSITVGTTAINYSVSRAEVINGSTNLKRIYVFVR